jgi:hypothetical protein
MSSEVNHNSRLKRAGITIITSAILAFAILSTAASFGISNNSSQQFLAPAHAQQSASAPAATVNATAALRANETFTANGQIGTLLSPSKQSSSQEILAGNWSISVSKGNITNFMASFVMVGTDGSDYHTHVISDFKVGNNTTFKLNPTGVSTINGTADVRVNGTIKWPGAHAQISINKLVVLTITLDPKDTSNHFGGQPIYGVVTSMTGTNNEKIVGTTPAATAGGGGSSSGGGGGVGGILGNITKPFQNLFGGGNKK